jgi:hypothetical protein
MLLAAVQKINAGVAFTMTTETTNIIMSLLQLQQTELILPNGFQVQVIDSICDIAASPSSLVKKFQYAALIREERILLVWHDDLDMILTHAANVEGKLLSLVCAPLVRPASPPPFWSLTRSITDLGKSRPDVFQPGDAQSHPKGVGRTFSRELSVQLAL